MAPTRRRLLRSFWVASATGLLLTLLPVFLAGPLPAQEGGRDVLGGLPLSDGVPVYGYTLIDSFPHDPNAFTQGLVYCDGFLYEGTGLYGGSSLRKVVLETGEIVKRRNLSASYFGEGVTVRRDTIYQLTWQNHAGFVYQEAEEFELIDTFTYPTEGWGLTHDDTSLIMSDGTDRLYHLDPHTYEETGRVYVTAGGSSVYYLNELELIRGLIYANIWYSDSIAVIEPSSGEVIAWLDLSGILPGPSPGVLNGIAFDPDSLRLFVTGKKWPTIFEIWVDPLDYPPEITSYSPPSPLCAYIDSPLVFSVSVLDLDPADSLEYTWSVNGIVDPSAEDTCYTYTGQVSAIDTVVVSVADGIFMDSVTWVVYVEIAGVDSRGWDDAGTSRRISFGGIGPNPLVSSAAIEFSVSPLLTADRVCLVMRDVLGRRVATLVDSDLPAGDYRVFWGGRDERYRKVPPGIYLCCLSAGRERCSRKIIVLN